jgi:hypothetical protein
MTTTAGHNNAHAYRRIMQKKHEVAIKQVLHSLHPDLLEKLRHDCLVAANERLRGASREEVMRAAAFDLESRLEKLGAGK